MGENSLDSKKKSGPLLILGGTADGRLLASSLHQKGIPVVYSVAGMVRKPLVDCEVISGGFTQFGGLSSYIKDKDICAVLDATHPYAQIMSTTAVKSASEENIPCWRFHREPWQAKADDQWFEFSSWGEMLPELRDKKSVFLSAGQLEQSFLDDLARNAEQKQLMRTAVKPKAELATSVNWVNAIGPFNYQEELALMQTEAIDVLVSKNSGGDSTVEKLRVARDLGIPVFMLSRPTLPAANDQFVELESCIDYVSKFFGER